MNPLFDLIESANTWFLQTDFGQFFIYQNMWLVTPEIIVLMGLLLGISVAMSKHLDVQRGVWRLMVMTMVFALFSLGSIFVMNHVDVTKQALFEQPVVRSVFHMHDNYAMLTMDLFGVLMRAAILLGTLLVLLFSKSYIEKRSPVPAEFYLLMVGASLGAMLLASANDLVILFVALETLGISSFILSGYLRGDQKSTEASLKYLIYGGASTACMLFGMSILYGMSGGHTNFPAIAVGLQQTVAHAGGNPAALAVVAVMMVLIMGGFAFKLSAAPFHMWTPDVYEGAPTPVTAYLSTVSKTGAFAVVVRFIVLMLAGFQEGVLPLFYILFVALAVLSMTLGNLAALKQTNIKRMLAYSTVAHVGYMLLGLVVFGINGSVASVSALVFYLLTYLFMNLGAFAVVVHISNELGREDLNAYGGLVTKRPWMAMYLSIFMLSLTGIPITAGFFAKFFLFQSVALAGAGLMWLVIVALVNSTISLFYYLNVIRLMVIAPPSDSVTALSRRIDFASALPVTICAALCFVVTMLMGIYATPVMNVTWKAVADLGKKDEMDNVHIMRAMVPFAPTETKAVAARLNQ